MLSAVATTAETAAATTAETAAATTAKPAAATTADFSHVFYMFFSDSEALVWNPCIFQPYKSLPF